MTLGEREARWREIRGLVRGATYLSAEQRAGAMAVLVLLDALGSGVLALEVAKKLGVDHAGKITICPL